MKNKSISYWIWIAVVLVLAILLTSLTQVKFAKPTEQPVASEGLSLSDLIGEDSADTSDKTAQVSNTDKMKQQQTASLGGIAAYVAVIFSCNVFGALALLVGSVLGVLFIGSYSYILPIAICRLMAFAILAIIRRKSTYGWKSCIIAAAITEGAIVVLMFLYELIFLGLTFGAAWTALFAHIVEGAVCGIIGIVLLKLFEPKAPEADSFTDFINAKESKKKSTTRNLK